MENLLTVDHLNIITKKKNIPLVNNISFNVKRGEVLVIVGESGSGKSITTQAVGGMLSKNLEYNAEKIIFNNRNLQSTNKKEWLKIRGNELGMIFQDPMTALNPTLTIGKQLNEIFIKKRKYSRKKATEQSIKLLKSVDITLPETRMKQYPHELSGGIRQRIIIAMALALSPDLIIADEPTTALDVTTQKQILSLFNRLKEESDSAVLLITHDLGVAAEIADRVAVMYGGEIVEQGEVEEIFSNPKHPYTIGLLSSLIKSTTDKSKELYSIAGTPNTGIKNRKECVFVDRCPFAMKICLEERPKIYENYNHNVSCWLEEVR